MTAKSDLKNIIRARMAKTGESFTAARLHVLNAQGELLADAGAKEHLDSPAQLTVAVLKLNDSSSRVRDLATNETITFRGLVPRLAPGHVVTLTVTRRWVYGGHAYASGSYGVPRIDGPALRLAPLGLEHQGVAEFSEEEGYSESPALYAMWDTVSGAPRPAYEMEVVPHLDIDELEDDPIIAASELNAAGHRAEAEDLLMALLATDLRCLDAHAHLGNFAFDGEPRAALSHYEIGVRIGELALPPKFDGILAWSSLGNRPFLRCLHGYALSLWRLRRTAEAEAAFERMLRLNPNDHQGARFCWDQIRSGRPWTGD